MVYALLFAVLLAGEKKTKKPVWNNRLQFCGDFTFTSHKMMPLKTVFDRRLMSFLIQVNS